MVLKKSYVYKQPNTDWKTLRQAGKTNSNNHRKQDVLTLVMWFVLGVLLLVSLSPSVKTQAAGGALSSYCDSDVFITPCNPSYLAAVQRSSEISFFNFWVVFFNE